MTTLIVIAILIFLSIGLKWAAKKLGILASDIEKAAREKERYHGELLGSIKNIEKQLSPPAHDDRIDTKAILANQKKIEEKRQIQRAIEEELGI